MPRLVLGLLFVAIALSVLAGGHLYIVQRLVLEPQLPEPWRGVALAVIIALAATLMAEPIAQRTLPRRLSSLVAWPASLWLGFSFLLVLILAASDLALWTLETPAWAADSGNPADGVAAWRALAVVAIAGFLGVVAVRDGLRPPAVTRVEHRLQRWPATRDGFRIVQISDLHIGPIRGRAFALDLAARVNGLAPDLIAVTGDLVDGSEPQLRDEVAPLADLDAPHGVWFVTGNHDYYSGAEAWVERVRSLGWHPLRNERVSIGGDDGAFDLAGVEDHHAAWVDPNRSEDLDAALEGRDPARPVVLLAHDPSTFKRASSLSIDLQLSGHTHGGQIWPFRYLVRLAVPFVSGLYERNASRLYVSRGTGFWGPPMRLLTPAEITQHVLRAAP
jgi:predicted MPP superfamily phosphohydrolase